MNWIIDTDAGVDDAVGIAMPFVPGRYPGFNLRAITTLSGNVPIDKVNVNVGAVLDLLGLDIPIFAGCDRPLIEPYVDASDFHGADGLGDAGLSKTGRLPGAEHAAMALVRLAREYSGDFGVIALGPLTNVALACNLDPEFHTRMSRLVIMGGAWRAEGNQSSAAEFNIAVDPESAGVVFDRFDDNVIMVPWEPSIDCEFPNDRMDAIDAVGTRRAQFFAGMSAYARRFCASIGRTGLPLPDPLAVAVALDEGVIKREIVCRVKVDIARHAGRGLTTLDKRHAQPNTRVVVDMHFDKAFEMIETAWKL